MPERPALDYTLCLNAERFATGEHIHTAANLLAVYLGEHSLDEFRPDRFREAEAKLREFVGRVLVGQIGAYSLARAWELRN